MLLVFIYSTEFLILTIEIIKKLNAGSQTVISNIDVLWTL